MLQAVLIAVSYAHLTIVTVLLIFQAVMDQETDNGIKNNYSPVLQLQGSRLHNARITQLKDHFIGKYKQEPEFFIRVPGRYVCRYLATLKIVFSCSNLRCRNTLNNLILYA